MTQSLVNQLNSTPFDFYFLVVDPFLDIEVPDLTNFFSLSPEKFGIKLDANNSGKLLSHPQIIDYIKTNSQKTGRKPAIIPFKPSAKIDLICQQNNWLLVSNPSSVNRLLEDKMKFYDLCSQKNLPLIPSLILPFNQENYLLAFDKFHSSLVLQTHFGWAGNSSYLSHNWADVSSQIPIDTIVKISPYLSGYSLINNCCLTSGQLIQSPPGLQYTGIKPLTTNPLATVGRQWPSFAPDAVTTQVHQITTDFCQSIEHLHYRGFFGLDFFVSENHVYLIECNPRLTASFAFYTQIEKANSLTPLFFLHLAEFIGINFPEPDHFTAQLTGSEITLKGPHGKTTKKYHELTAFVSDPNNLHLDNRVLSQVL